MEAHEYRRQSVITGVISRSGSFILNRDYIHWSYVAASKPAGRRLKQVKKD